MADWEEIKRLAADFQRAQLTGTLQKLSERNCIEIVQRLCELKLIDVIYTTDGKEYLTPQELGKEIREELLVHGGRINLVELQQILNVDFSHIETKVNELVKGDRHLSLILGQLIDRSYLDSLAEQINDRLQEHGLVTVAELTKLYDLPGDFISQLIETRLGRSIKGQKDELDRNVIYTESFVARHRAKIRGAFTAITKPTSVSSVLNHYGLQERLFYSILDNLISVGRLNGVLAGGKQEKAVYIPDIYTKTQNQWVDAFYKQNGYLEYDSLTRLGITEPKAYIKKIMKNDKLEYLETCCVGRLIVDQIESEVDETLANDAWIDILPLMPSICTPNDAYQLLQDVVRHKTNAAVFCDSIVCSETFINKSAQPFDSAIRTKAEQAVRENPSLLLTSRSLTLESGSSQREDKKEQRRKKASSGKSGGGTQGREVRTKSSKKKVHNRDDKDDNSDDDEATGQHDDDEFMCVAEITQQLKQQPPLKDCSEDFLAEISAKIYRPLSRLYKAQLKSVFLQTVQTNAGGAPKKKTYSDLTDRVNGLWSNAKLYEKGIKLFNDEVQSHLTRYLLKSICSDLVNIVFNVYAADVMMAIDMEKDGTPELRVKLLSMLTDEKTKTVLTKLHTSLDKSLEEFFNQLDAVCGPGFLEITLKKADKQKERQIVFNNKQSLMESLRQEVNPAMVVHVACILLVQVYTQCMLHAPGRCIPHIITFLKDHIPKEQLDLLMQCQDLIVKQLKLAGESSATREDQVLVESQLGELLPKLKDITLTSKRTAASSTNDV